jgi:hypothetical protein
VVLLRKSIPQSRNLKAAAELNVRKPMKEIAVVFMIFFSASLLADEVNLNNGSENEIILGCLREAPPVVYINPKNSLKKKIAAFLEIELATGKLGCKSENNESWYCEKKQFRLYQGMNSMGNKMEQGLVCKAEYEAPLEKLYKEELILEPTCFRVFWGNNSFSAFYGKL